MNFFEKHLQFFLLFYLLIGGVFFYLLGATIDTIFVPTVDQPDGFCEEWTERALRWHRAQDCIKFKNRIEELKYKHNKGDYLGYTTGMIATAVLLGVVMGFVMPIICQAFLPPPAEWFPQEFMEIRRARIELILNEISEKIQLVSQEGKGP
jgi:hypothetical protein